MSGALNHSARVWFSAPFEQNLANELARVRQPELRPMLMQLVMLHIAKDARLARLQVIGFESTPASREPVLNYALQANQAVNSIRAGDLVSIRPGASMIASDDTMFNGWAALGFFLLAVLWVTMRRG